MNLKRITILFSFAVALLLPSVTSAASLELNPPTGSYVVGDTISVDVFVNTLDETVNAVSGEIQYDPSLLRAESVSRTNSIVDLWVQEPSVVGDNKVLFEGLMLNPGFTGKSKVIRVNFKVVGTGDGITTVSFTSGLVLKNDGFGTNVLRDLSGATFSLLPSAEARDAVGLPASSDVEDSGEDTLVPAVISYTENPFRLDNLFIRGVTYPNAQVNVYLQPEDGEEIEQHIISSDPGGNFTYKYGDSVDRRTLATANVFLVLQSLAQPLTKENYQFWLTAVHENVETNATQPFDIVVGGVVTSIPGIIITLIVIALALVGFLLFSSRRHQKHIVKEMKKDIDNISYDIEKYEAKQRQDSNKKNIHVK